jgi:catechol 2,3-dioxygenase-like lactoylglutathione lyase family enzyme
MSTTPHAVGSASPFASWRFDHVAIRVPEYEAAVAWYREKLDFRLINGAPIRGKTFGFMAAPGDPPHLVIELIAGEIGEMRPTYHDLSSSFGLSGLHHAAFRVDDVDDTVARLRDRGVTIVSEPHDVPSLALRVAFFADPWGNLFEVIRTIDVQGPP